MIFCTNIAYIYIVQIKFIKPIVRLIQLLMLIIYMKNTKNRIFIDFIIYKHKEENWIWKLYSFLGKRDFTIQYVGKWMPTNGVWQSNQNPPTGHYLSLCMPVALSAKTTQMSLNCHQSRKNQLCSYSH